MSSNIGVLKLYATHLNNTGVFSVTPFYLQTCNVVNRFKCSLLDGTCFLYVKSPKHLIRLRHIGSGDGRTAYQRAAARIHTEVLNKPTRCSWVVTFISLVSGASCTHHQEYNNCICSPWYDCTSDNHLPTWQDMNT